MRSQCNTAAKIMEVYWCLVATFLLLTFVVVPLGVDLLRFLFPYWRLSRIVGKVAHIFLFFTVAGLILIIIRYHIAVFLPLLLNHESTFSSAEGYFHVVFSSWLWLNMLGNYYHTISTHPGVDTSFRSRRVKFEEAKRAYYGISIELAPSDTVNGKKLEALLSASSSRKKDDSDSDCEVKPASRREWRPCRTHFCSVCRCAISYWDHHCPFTGNCIGLRNYLHFFICLCYGALSSVYALLITGPYFYHCNMLPFFWGELEHQDSDDCLYLGANSYIFLPVLLGFGLVSWMVFLNVVFLLADVSTYDVLRIKKKQTIFQLLWQRIQTKKFMDSDSRLQVLIVKRRRGLLWYLLPVRSIQFTV